MTVTINNLEKYETDLEALFELGSHIMSDLTTRMQNDDEVRDSSLRLNIFHPENTRREPETENNKPKTLEEDYQRWYTEASSLVRQLAPSRLDEFNRLYMGDGKRGKEHSDATDFTIQD